MFSSGKKSGGIVIVTSSVQHLYYPLFLCVSSQASSRHQKMNGSNM